MAAPDGQNQGEFIFLSYRAPVITDMELTTTGQYFINQADSSPAVYNARDTGHNNRQGWIFDVNAQFAKLGFTARAHYVQARVIESLPYQQDFQFVSAGLEFRNVLF